MSFVDALNQFNTKIPTPDESYEMLVQSQPMMSPPDPSTQQWEWQKQYDAIRSAASAATSKCRCMSSPVRFLCWVTSRPMFVMIIWKMQRC